MIVAKRFNLEPFQRRTPVNLHSETSAVLVVFVTTIPARFIVYFLEMHFMMKNENIVFDK